MPDTQPDTPPAAVPPPPVPDGWHQLPASERTLPGDIVWNHRLNAWQFVTPRIQGFMIRCFAFVIRSNTPHLLPTQPDGQKTILH